MRIKTCGECQWYDHHHLLCVIGGDVEPTEKAKDCFVSANPTNGDRIRHMSNEELVRFKGARHCTFCAYCDQKTDKCNRPIGGTCAEGILEWINAPAEIKESEGGGR